MDKLLQRKYCFSKRAQLTDKERSDFSKMICDRLFSLGLEGNIMSYYPFNDEADISFFNFHSYVSYPVISTDRQMEAYLPIENDFTKNYYGIREPNTSTAVKVEKEYISHIIVPCVGFDEDHYRMGYGGGYYDRYLKDVKATLIGVAFDIQKVDNIVHLDHDIRLDMIVTEKSIY